MFFTPFGKRSQKSSKHTLWFFLRALMLGVVFSLMGMSSSMATPYPQRPIILKVTFPPGGGTDLLARKLAEQLADYLPEPMVVENRPGASGNIGARQVAQARADGHTLLMVNSSYAINPGFYTDLGFEPEHDLIPVANISWVPSVWVAHPASGPQDFAEAISSQSGQPALQYGSCGPGTPQHLAAEMLSSEVDVTLEHVPYNGCGPALNDVLAGHISTAFVTLSSAAPYIERGDVLALAVTSAERSNVLEKLPTVAEQIGKNFDVSQWHAIFAPAHTPEAVLAYLRKQLQRVLTKPEIQADLKALGYELATETTAEFERIVRTDLHRYQALAKEIQAGIKE